MMPNYKITRFACYSSYLTMAAIFALPPLLLATYHDMYGISYTLLGTLVLTNFMTQLSIDMIFVFFSKYFNPKSVVRIMPLITSAGLTVYALSPLLFPSKVFLGLLLGTVIFSISAGLSEVLLSPVIAALPSDNPSRDMSLLHSLYGVGVVMVIVISTAFFALFGNENWTYLALLFAALPLLSAALFMLSPIPDMQGKEKNDGGKTTKRRTLGLAFCVCCIFFGSCAENTMSNWVSGFMETSVGIDKAFGDILGAAMFAVLLAATRIAYAKYGKSISKMLTVGMIGAILCYLIAGLSNNTVVVLSACALTGLFTSMLWPGSLILMEENLPGIGVAAYALMASGGDLGASVAPQLMGMVVDGVSSSSLAAGLSLKLGLSVEQLGMKAGMLVTTLFPVCGLIVLLLALRYFNKNKNC
ncbi:MAG: MFS transporter [Eubacteriales bacterium]